MQTLATFGCGYFPNSMDDHEAMEEVRGGPVETVLDVPAFESASDTASRPKPKRAMSFGSLDAGRGVSDDQKDQKAYDALVQCQELHMKKILEELDHGAKESCWIWYIFPTEKAGYCDFDGTRITKKNAVELCNNESTASDWRKCLEKICDLLEAQDKRPPDHVLPRIDHGRVGHFIKFWKNYSESPEWMQAICNRLDTFKFPSSSTCAELLAPLANGPVRRAAETC